jgi:hypothetical protein
MKICTGSRSAEGDVVREMYSHDSWKKIIKRNVEEYLYLNLYPSITDVARRRESEKCVFVKWAKRVRQKEITEN